MDYREHGPSAACAPWLACLWERTGDGEAPVRVLPDGCIDVVWTAGGETQVVGANTTAFLVSVRSGMPVIGARLRPGAAPALLGISAQLVRDSRVPVRDALGEAGARLAAQLDRGVGDGRDPVQVLGGWLEGRAAQAGRPDPLVAAAVRRLAGSAAEVGRLAGDLGISERALRRRVTTAVGYGPKLLARILRLERALVAARAGGDLGGVAFDAGYADQAHFSHDCRELAGLPPASLTGRRAERIGP